MQFRTHTGEIVEGVRLQAAFAKVANDWRNLARAIRTEDAYASHVSEESKEADLVDMLKRADAIEAGEIGSFAIWQRIDTELTGRCVAFLPA